MDLKSKNKVLNIILSIFIFLLIFAPVGGLLAGIYVSEMQILYEGTSMGTTKLLDLLKSSFEAFKNLNFDNSSAAGSTVVNLLSNLFFLGAFFAAAIIVTINSVILLVNTIKGLTKGVPSGKITKPLLRIAVSIAGYISIMLGMFFLANPASHAYLTIGVGPLVQLGVAILYIIIASVMHIATRSDHKAVGKVFQIIVTFLAFITLIILFVTPFKDGDVLSFSMIQLFLNSIYQTIVSEDPQTVYISILGAIGFGLLVASFFTLTKVVTAPMGGNAGEKKNRDYGISTIIRSAVFLTLFGAGIAFIIITFLRLHFFADFKYSIIGIVTIASAVTLLILSIVAKSVDKMPPVTEEAKTEEAPKEELTENKPEESEVLQEPEENNALEQGEEDHDKVEEENKAPETLDDESTPEDTKKEEVVILVAEEPKPEAPQAAPQGPKFCPNCGTPTNGSKFCPNCGTKLL